MVLISTTPWADNSQFMLLTGSHCLYPGNARSSPSDICLSYDLASYLGIRTWDMDTIIQQPNRMLTELPTLLPSSHPYATQLSSQDLRWRFRPIPNHRHKHIIEDSRLSLEVLEVTEIAQTTHHAPKVLHQSFPASTAQIRLQDLPEEIQQGVLDSLMGNLSSTSSSAVVQSHGMRNWSNAMRHPRGRHLSNLALVSPSWRRMIQERLYRHGTASLSDLTGFC